MWVNYICFQSFSFCNYIANIYERWLCDLSWFLGLSGLAYWKVIQAYIKELPKSSIRCVRTGVTKWTPKLTELRSFDCNRTSAGIFALQQLARNGSQNCTEKVVWRQLRMTEHIGRKTCDALLAHTHSVFCWLSV